ncbi:MAG: hypothetical protein LBH16_00550 [Treponema sp.]|jgi:hypothetical protein|nr:hypothetical protein [Treponema sp.]
MKRLGLVLVLAAIIATGTVFADIRFYNHHDGFAFGAQFSGNFATNEFGLGAALSLKLPGVPVFWAVDYAFSDLYYGIGLSGDFYFIDTPLLRTLGLYWYFGAGLGGFVWLYDRDTEDNYLRGAVTGRVPVGVCWHLLSLFEVYLQVVPQAGVLIHDGTEFFWDAPVNLGVRIWL